jgi:acyl-coenzyme A thioesterase 13
VNSAWPHGLQRYARESPFLERALGPMYEGERDGLWVLGLRTEPHHLNARGAVHGGVLSTLADVGLGHAVALSNRSAHPTTIGLSIDYLDRAVPGGWLEVRTHVLRIGRRLAFSRGELYSDDRLVARANATFAVARRR